MREEDRRIGVVTIYGEARGSTQQDRLAIAHVILNRANAGRWWGTIDGKPDHTIEAVCLRPWQFSCWNEGDPNRKQLDEILADFEGALAEMKPLRAAEKALIDAHDGFEADPTGGATHYVLTDWLNDPKLRPDWADRLEPVGAIGAHTFFRLPDNN